MGIARATDLRWISSRACRIVTAEIIKEARIITPHKSVRCVILIRLVAVRLGYIRDVRVAARNRSVTERA